LGPILVVSFLFYLWTGTTEANPIRFGSQNDYYNLLTNAFLKGRLSLLGAPPKALLSLQNPFDPHQNLPFQRSYHDLVLYHGHFYVTWGPTPVLTLLMPWRLFHLGGFPVNLAVILYSFAGLVFSVLLLCFLTDRYLRQTKTWQLAVATVALALGNVAPFLLRRPDVYELAISSAFCFAMLGMYLLALGALRDRVRPWQLAFGSLSLGLAVGGRPSLIVEGIFLAVVLVLLLRRERKRTLARSTRVAALLVGPFTLIVGLLFAYNFARFGSLLQNGSSYTLENVDPSRFPIFSLSYVTPGLYYYVVSPVRWTLAFPYFTLAPPPSFSGPAPSYYSSEITGGLLTTTPILVVLIPAVVSLWRRRERALLAIVGAMVGVGALVMILVSSVFWGTTMRYEMDFASLFLLPALLGWFAISRGPRHRLVKVIGAIAIAYGCMVGAAISIYGYFDDLRIFSPATYWALARVTSPVPTLVTMAEGHPVVSRAFLSELVSFGNSVTYQISSQSLAATSTGLEIDVVSPSAGRFALHATFWRMPGIHGSVMVAVNGQLRTIAAATESERFTVGLGAGLNRIPVTVAAPGYSRLMPVVGVTGIALDRHALRQG
jgi:hypothetical protein